VAPPLITGALTIDQGSAPADPEAVVTVGEDDEWTVPLDWLQPLAMADPRTTAAIRATNLQQRAALIPITAEYPDGPQKAADAPIERGTEMGSPGQRVALRLGGSSAAPCSRPY
jgi:hypothetical protein